MFCRTSCTNTSGRSGRSQIEHVRCHFDPTKILIPNSPDNSLISLIDNLIERCGIMIGPQCHVTVSICIMQLIKNFIKFCSKEKRMILAAKLFPILNRRFDDLDLRVSRQESIRIIRTFCSS